MCGIVGILSKKGVKKEKVVDAILKGYDKQKHRGRDSFGVMVVSDRGRYIKKTMKERGIKNLFNKGEKFYFVAFHHRLASVGSKNYIKNQHPHKYGNIILIHNGTWSSHTLYRNRYNDLKSETDTEVITALINENYENLKKVRNSALVFFDRKDNTVNFWRNGKPIVFAYDDEKQILLFASERETLFVMMTKLGYKKNFGFINALPTANLPENMLYKFKLNLRLETIKTIIPEKPSYSRTSYWGYGYNYYNLYDDCPFDCDYHSQSPCFECEEIYGCGSNCETCPFRGGCEMEMQRKKFGCSLCDVGEQSLV